MIADLKKLAIQAFLNNRIDSLTFYVRKKPSPTDHILVRLRYKNDKLYRVFLKYNNGFSYAHHFTNKDGLLQTIGFVTVLGDMFNADGRKSIECSVPKEWLEFEPVVFHRTAMQKLLHLK